MTMNFRLDIDLLSGRYRSAIVGCYRPHVVRYGGRRIDAAPTHELSAPRHVRIFAVYEKIRVEKVTLHGNIVNHLATKEGRGGPLPAGDDR